MAGAPMQNYDIICKIAEGAFGVVFKANAKGTLTGGSGFVAIKRLKSVVETAAEFEFIMREIELLRLLKHANVVQLIQACESRSGRIYMVFEYVDHTLQGLLRSFPMGLLPSQVKAATQQLLQALKYLHSNNVVHRDLKPSNVLVSADGQVKLCDFGFARTIDSSAPGADLTQYVVTRWYRPPEILVGDTYGPAVDVWALGCIFAELLTGRALFPGRNHNDQLWLVMRGVGQLTAQQMRLLRRDPQLASFRQPMPRECVPLAARFRGLPREALQVIRACLHPDPLCRMTAEQLLQLPYFAGSEDRIPMMELVTASSAQSEVLREAPRQHTLQQLAARTQAEMATRRQAQAQAQIAAPASAVHGNGAASAAVSGHDAAAPSPAVPPAKADERPQAAPPELPVLLVRTTVSGPGADEWPLLGDPGSATHAWATSAHVEEEPGIAALGLERQQHPTSQPPSDGFEFSRPLLPLHNEHACIEAREDGAAADHVDIVSAHGMPRRALTLPRHLSPELPSGETQLLGDSKGFGEMLSQRISEPSSFTNSGCHLDQPPSYAGRSGVLFRSPQDRRPVNQQRQKGPQGQGLAEDAVGMTGPRQGGAITADGHNRSAASEQGLKPGHRSASDSGSTVFPDAGALRKTARLSAVPPGSGSTSFHPLTASLEVAIPSHLHLSPVRDGEGGKSQSEGRHSLMGSLLSKEQDEPVDPVSKVAATKHEAPALGMPSPGQTRSLPSGGDGFSSKLPASSRSGSMDPHLLGRQPVVAFPAGSSSWKALPHPPNASSSFLHNQWSITAARSPPPLAMKLQLPTILNRVASQPGPSQLLQAVSVAPLAAAYRASAAGPAAAHAKRPTLEPLVPRASA